MSKAVSGDALTALREALIAKLSDEMDPDGAVAMVRRFEDALIAAGRSTAAPQCDVLWANHNRCVKPAGHTGPHLTDSGFDWQAPAPAPLPAPTAADEPR